MAGLGWEGRHPTNRAVKGWANPRWGAPVFWGGRANTRAGPRAQGSRAVERSVRPQTGTVGLRPTLRTGGLLSGWTGTVHTGKGTRSCMEPRLPLPVGSTLSKIQPLGKRFRSILAGVRDCPGGPTGRNWQRARTGTFTLKMGPMGGGGSRGGRARGLRQMAGILGGGWGRIALRAKAGVESPRAYSSSHGHFPGRSWHKTTYVGPQTSEFIFCGTGGICTP